MIDFPMTSTTNVRATVARYTIRLRDVIRFARSATTVKQSDGYVRQLAKDSISRERSKCIEQVCALVVDAAQRGTLEEAESIGLELVAIARAEHATAHPDGTRCCLTRDEAGMLEQQAQGERENAEKAMDLDPTNVSKALRFLATSAKYSRASRALDEAVRADVVAA